MIKIVEELKTITRKEYYCDVCGKEISVYDVNECTMCDKIICDKCLRHSNNICRDSNRYCKSCWDKGEKYREDIKKLEEQIEELDKEWEECKERGVQSEISKS